MILLEVLIPAIVCAFVGFDLGSRHEHRRVMRILSDPMIFPQHHVVPMPFPLNEYEARLYDQDAT